MKLPPYEVIETDLEDMGIKVAIVNGEIVRSCIDVQFMNGGHGLVYSYIPEDEIWVEKMISKRDQIHNFHHEVVEYWLMLDGMSYDKAHEIALEYERNERTSDGLPR